jgi:uncharacterized OsmC-like protein
MSNVELIKTAVERSTKAISLRPAIGQGAEMMSFDVDETGCCRVADGDEQIVIDLSEEYGGEGKTPSAGFFVRAALGACLAQGYYVQAACFGVPISRLSVELHSDHDMRGPLGIDDSVPRSYTGIRYIVRIESTAPRNAVEEMIDKSDDLDWVRDVFARAIPLERELQIGRPATAD